MSSPHQLLSASHGRFLMPDRNQQTSPSNMTEHAQLRSAIGRRHSGTATGGLDLRDLAENLGNAVAPQRPKALPFACITRTFEGGGWIGTQDASTWMIRKNPRKERGQVPGARVGSSSAVPLRYGPFSTIDSSIRVGTSRYAVSCPTVGGDETVGSLSASLHFSQRHLRKVSLRLLLSAVGPFHPSAAHGCHRFGALKSNLVTLSLWGLAEAGKGGGGEQRGEKIRKRKDGRSSGVSPVLSAFRSEIK